jgi:uncharacterized repeat protein (TIGR01451 family)
MIWSKTVLLIVLTCSTVVHTAVSQNSIGIQWQRCIAYQDGGTAVSLLQLSNGDLACLGNSVLGITVTKTTKSGATIWAKAYNRPFQFATAYGFAKTQDGGFIIIGNVSGNCVAPSIGSGSSAIWVIKTDGLGNTQWDGCYGGPYTDFPVAIQQLTSGNYILASNTSSVGAIAGGHGSSEIWLRELSASGAVVWERYFGGSGLDNCTGLKVTSDNGFLISGRTGSSDGDLTGHHGNDDGFIAKFDMSSHNLLWSNCYGDTFIDYLNELVVDASNNVYAIGGSAPLVGLPGFRGIDNIWLIKVSNTGNLLWQKSFGGSEIDEGFSLALMPDGDLAVCGLSLSTDGDMQSNYYKHRYWVAKIDPVNSVIKLRALLGGKDFDNRPQDVAVTPDGEILVFGTVTAANPYVTGYLGGNKNMWLKKLGAFNAIKGNIYIDRNFNGTKESNEPYYDEGLVSIKRVSATDSTHISSFGGHFIANVDTGTFETTFNPYKPYYIPIPSPKTSSFSSYYNTDSFDIRLTPIPGKKDLVISIVDPLAIRAGGADRIIIRYKNVGTETVPAFLKFIKDPKTDFSNSIPAITNIVQDTITWNLGILNPFDSGSVRLTLAVKPPPFTAHGTVLRHFGEVSHGGIDETPADNHQGLMQIVLNSFDPNDKRELSKGGTLSTRDISNGEFLNYMIRFQNTGNDTAFNVVIKDTLSQLLDVQSFHMIGSSHAYSLKILNGNVLQWSFSDIKLVDSIHNEPLSHGYVAFRVKPKNIVAPGDSIKNNSSIYFDFNLPVKTNTAIVAVQLSALPTTLVTFNAALHNGEVEVSWKTAYEQNISSFEVQRSATGNNFISIGKITANNSGSGSSYLFIDRFPQKGKNYYRIKMLEADGSSAYSRIARIDRETSDEIALQISPNPSSERIDITINGDLDSGVEIILLDQTGKELIRKVHGRQNSDHLRTMLPLKGLKKGSYILKVQVDGRKISRQVIVQ